MQITSSLTRSRRRSRKRAKATASPGHERNQRANVNQDSALYNCSCGYIFKAEVSTEVGCPHCGSAQAW